MVSIKTVRSSNSTLKELGPGLVAVFVGGTSGIGETTAREFVRNTLKPTVYLIGRNEGQASTIIAELRKINPDGKLDFIKSDVSLLKNVDSACDEIKSKEERINLLFMSPGILSMKGRDETTEGLDKKLNLHYYTRMRFAVNLMPQLTRASQSGGLSRVVSVLAGGREAKLNLDDLALKSHFTLKKCGNHAITMNSLAAEELAIMNPGTTFIHAYPGIVNTNLGRDFGPLVKVGVSAIALLIYPWTVPIGESGERHLYAATSKDFSGGEKQDGAVPGKAGAFLLSWDGSSCDNAIMQKYREESVGKQIWKHTLDVFEKVCGSDGGKY